MRLRGAYSLQYYPHEFLVSCLLLSKFSINGNIHNFSILLIYTTNSAVLRYGRYIQHGNRKSWCFKYSTPILSEEETSQKTWKII